MRGWPLTNGPDLARKVGPLPASAELDDDIILLGHLNESIRCLLWDFAQPPAEF
jgi:hypothetical protein